MKPDETALYEAIKQRGKSMNPSVWEIVKSLGMNEKRAAYILNKWTDKGKYNWGVNVFYGWLEKEC